MAAVWERILLDDIASLLSTRWVVHWVWRPPANHGVTHRHRTIDATHNGME